jgi:hypothetical protein
MTLRNMSDSEEYELINYFSSGMCYKSITLETASQKREIHTQKKKNVYSRYLESTVK